MQFKLQDRSLDDTVTGKVANICGIFRRSSGGHGPSGPVVIVAPVYGRPALVALALRQTSVDISATCLLFVGLVVANKILLLNLQVRIFVTFSHIVCPHYITTSQTFRETKAPFFRIVTCMTL